MPARYDLDVRKGNTHVLRFRLKTRTDGVEEAVDLTGSTLVFRALWRSGSLRKEGEDEGFAILDALAGEARLTLTTSETRSLPNGPVRYEVERRIDGEQTTVLFGNLRVTEWTNDD